MQYRAGGRCFRLLITISRYSSRGTMLCPRSHSFGTNLAEVYPGNAKDSYSFLPVLKDPASSHQRPLMFGMGSYRKDNWKIVVGGDWLTVKKGSALTLNELFDLESDLSEKRNALQKHPEIAESLFTELKHFVDTRELKPRAAQSNRKKRPKGKNKK